MAWRWLVWVAVVSIVCLRLSLCAGAQLLDGEIDSDLEDLCNSTTWPLLDNPIVLREAYYLVPNGTECRVEGVGNLTVVGNQTVIHCNGSAIFSFVNVAFLSIKSIHFVGCGAILSDNDLRYLTERPHSYFDSNQTAALLCSHCLDLFLHDVIFSNSTGYSFVGINCYGNSTLDGVQVLGNDEDDSPDAITRCSESDDESNSTCINGGMLLFFADSNYTFFADSNYTFYPTQMLLKNSLFHSNSVWKKNLSADSSWFHCVKGVFETFIVSPEHQKSPFLPYVGALTIVYTQTWEAEVEVLNSDFINNHGLCFGAVFVLMHTFSVNSSHQQFNDCRFSRNSPRAVPDKNGKNYFGSDVTMYMQYMGGHEARRCLSMTTNSMTSLNNSASPSLSIIHFPSTSGK